MNNAMQNPFDVLRPVMPTETGTEALHFIDMGLEVAADMEADDEPNAPSGMAADLRRIVGEAGLGEVLATIHDAALGAAEVHEEGNEIVAVRLQVFCARLREAMSALR